jgi:LPXTG-motif cell wall-anchored protein
MSALRRALVAATALALGLAGALVIATPASAAGCEVTKTVDDGTDGTLRWALETAVCPVVTFDPLVFNTPQTINLDGSKAALIIEQSVTIQGPGRDLLTVERASNALVYSIFQVIPTVAAPVDVTINDLTVEKDATGDPSTELGTGFFASASSLLRNLELNRVTIQNQDYGQDGAGMRVEVMTGTATLNEVLFQNNSSVSDTAGALYINGATTLSITNTTFESNTALHGGALRFENVGTVDIDFSVFDQNIGLDSGGAIGLGMTSGYGPVTITNTTFSKNEAQDGYGGAIFTDGSIDAPFTIARSTFDGNSAFQVQGVAQGGAIYVNGVDEPFTIDSSTFTNNSTDGVGTSVSVNDIGTGEASLFFIVNSTFDEDQSGDSGDTMIDVFQNRGTFSIKYSTLVGFLPVWVGNSPGTEAVASTIVQSAPGQPDLYGDDDPFQTEFSILSKALDTLNVTDLGGNQFSTDALLGALQNNGGPTETRMPANTSPALGKGGPTLGAPVWDQRFTGFPRIVGVLDAGAVEIPAVLPATGSTIPMWIPIVGGVVLLLGLLAIVFTVVSRRRLHAAEGSATEAAPRDDAGPPAS